MEPLTNLALAVGSVVKGINVAPFIYNGKERVGHTVEDVKEGKHGRYVVTKTNDATDLKGYRSFYPQYATQL